MMGSDAGIQKIVMFPGNPAEIFSEGFPLVFEENSFIHGDVLPSHW
jgi:hypothetical protein